MKLSMSIIEHWIRNYQPVSIIHTTEPTITGMRLFSYEKTPLADYLYVGRTRDFFENSASNEVLLVHRQDVISLNTHELEDVFDTLMDMFSFYSKWEQDMLSAIQTENPEQTIIDACSEIFGPMFFANRSMQITAFSKQYPSESINQSLDDFGNYPYSMVISQENAEHKRTGQLTIISREPIQDYEKQLAITLKQVLCMVANTKVTEERVSIVQSLFQDFLSGRKNDETSFRAFYQLQNWKPEQACMIVILKTKQPSLAASLYHIRVLRKSFPNILFCSSSALSEELDEKIVCCVPLAHLPKEAEKNRFGTEIPTRFIQLAENLNLQYFCSYPLTGIEQLSAQFRQAEVCQQQGKTWYYDCALSDLADLRSSSLTRQLALHPALARILQYDQQKNTDFYHILKTYLRCERDRVLTAQLLYQHKNTLVYRLEKIKELFTLDLDDPYEREYLLISFRCMDLL